MTSAGGSANDGIIFSNPDPEPSTLLLVGPAGATFLAYRRRRKI
jgi:hypothetical protein